MALAVQRRQDSGSEIRTRIIASVLRSIAEGPLARCLSTAKLEQALKERFDRFCDGRSFDFEPITRAVLREGRITEAECYVSVAGLAESLEGLGITVKEPPYSLDKEARARIAENVRRFRTRPAETKVQRLGEMLVQQRIISEAQLAQALRAQASFGGRIGSHLVKLGYVQDSALSHFLGAQRNIASIHRGMLRPPRETAQLVPSDLALEHKMFGLALKEGVLRVAMVDPRNHRAIRELQERTGHRVAAMIAPEVVVDAVLEEHFSGKQAQPRSISMTGIDAGGGDDFQVIHTSQRKQKRPSVPAEEVLEVANDDIIEISAKRPSITVEDRGEFLKLERSELSADKQDLSDDLARALDSTAVLRVLAKIMATRFRRSIAFSASEGTAKVAACHGCEAAEADLKTITLEVEECGLFRDLGAQREHAYGRHTPTAIDRSLLSVLGLEDQVALTRVAVMERDRVVGYLLACEELESNDARFLSRITQKAKLALEIVRLRKRLAEI
jgi:hypothetical protein